ncbi:MAG: hypothetical protein ACT4PO_15845 [Actinomycetota bacterium]
MDSTLPGRIPTASAAHQEELDPGEVQRVPRGLETQAGHADDPALADRPPARSSALVPIPPPPFESQAAQQESFATSLVNV